MRNKTECQICKDGYGDEEMMLGMCCGLPLVQVPWTEEDYESERKREVARKNLLEAAKKLDW